MTITQHRLTKWLEQCILRSQCSKAELPSHCARGHRKVRAAMKRIEYLLTAALIFGDIFGSVRLFEMSQRPHASLSLAPPAMASIR